MNARAVDLGMAETVFANPDGADWSWDGGHAMHVGR